MDANPTLHLVLSGLANFEVGGRRYWPWVIIVIFHPRYCFSGAHVRSFKERTNFRALGDLISLAFSTELRATVQSYAIPFPQPRPCPRCTPTPAGV